MKSINIFFKVALFLLISFASGDCNAQERIVMTKSPSGTFTVPCEVNGLKLKFVFDTGASDVSLSLVEAAFMIKNGYLEEDDFQGTRNYSLADGSIEENAIVNLRCIKIGSKYLYNVKACVSSKISASLLLGQSALSKLGTYTIDGNILIIHPKSSSTSTSNIQPDDTYIGDYKNGLRHGKGKCTYRNGDVYEGEWENDKYNGKGTFTWNNGEKYVGRFVNGYREGKGTYYWPSGEKYDGDWASGKRSGYGTHYYSDGSIYEGYWKNSKRDGKGKIVYSDGITYIGDWLTNEKEGKGTMTWPEGAKYEGNFVNGYREGHGIYTWSNGDSFDGNWKKNSREGYGTMTYIDGEKYYGDWKNSKRHGFGTAIYSSGNKYAGYWEDNDFNGEGTYTWASGDKYVGSFSNGLRDGQGTYFWKSGAKFVGSWKQNKRSGYGTYYYDDGESKYSYWENDEEKAITSTSNNQIGASSYSSTGINNRDDDYSSANPKSSAKYYIAKVTTTLNLRDEPSIYGEVITKIPAGELVFYASDDISGDFVKVLYVNKDIDGYVSTKYLTDQREIEIDEDGILQVIGQSQSYSNADVEIENQTDVNVTIKLGNTSYKLSKREKRKITLAPGTYNITASSPGILPYIGKDKVEAGYRYSWHFYITQKK